MQPPLTARTQQPVDHQEPDHLLPIRPLPARGQPGAEEAVQVQLPPELITQPARPPLPRMLQAQLTQPHLQRVHLARRRSAVRGKQGQLSRLPVPLIDHRNRALPRHPLAVVDLSEMQHMPVRHLAPRIAPALHHRPTPMRFAVLAPRPAFEEHACSLLDPRRSRKRRGRDYTHFGKHHRVSSTTCVAASPEKSRFLFPVAEERSGGTRAR